VVATLTDLQILLSQVTVSLPDNSIQVRLKEAINKEATNKGATNKEAINKEAINKVVINKGATLLKVTHHPSKVMALRQEKVIHHTREATALHNHKVNGDSFLRSNTVMVKHHPLHLHTRVASPHRKDILKEDSSHPSKADTAPHHQGSILHSNRVDLLFHLLLVTILMLSSQLI
jgi:hypothetical protein